MGSIEKSSRFSSAASQDDFVEPRYFNQEQQPDADLLRSRYNEFIKYCDSEFQYFIERLEKKGRLNNTVIILSSDHGESFEHGYLTHGGPILFEQMTSIPLIIKMPGQKGGQIFNDLVDQVDIPATILDLAGLPLPSWMEGRSLVPILKGETLQPRPIFSTASLAPQGQSPNRWTVPCAVCGMKSKRGLPHRLSGTMLFTKSMTVLPVSLNRARIL